MGGGPGFIRQGPDESRLLEKQRYGARGGNPDYGGSLRLSRSALSTEEGNIAEPNSNIIDLDTKRQERERDRCCICGLLMPDLCDPCFQQTSKEAEEAQWE